ncbi:hypothetical protein [Halorubrum laminariae]|uniref:RING-type E3 ubiquitin transferase n=1 Tax=Halorubrum laminariae TaxID=1433523 RepID=A0ABD6C1K9_9EURY|nr:hypothetical protein [Halorubrum laminariae]
MAVYAALFLLIAGVAGVLTATAESPEIALENPDFEVSEGDTIDVDGQTYTVAAISETEEGGGDHGGSATTVISGTLEREYQTQMSETWANESTVTIDDTEWRVEITGEDPSGFTLVEVLDRQAILESDDNADNETDTREDGEYVAVTEDGETTLVPADEYFPEPDERSLSTGDEIEYDGQTVTVDEVTPDQAVVVWEGTQTETIDVGQESMITIGETEFIANYPDASTLSLSTDIAAYEAQVEQRDQHQRYNNGLTRVIVLSILSTLLLAATAFVPSRY